MGFKLAGILFIAMMLMGTGFAWYYKNSQERIGILQENNAQLNVAVATNEETISSLQQDFARANQALTEVNEQFAAVRRQNQILTDKLAKHDLGVLGANKPVLVERIINRASEKAGRCFELLSGAELTEGEKNAKTANEFNSECPWLWVAPVSNP